MQREPHRRTQRLPVPRPGERAAAKGERNGRVLAADFDTAEADFDRRSLGIIAERQIGGAEGGPIHRSGWRHAIAAIEAAPAVLDRRARPGAQDAQMRRHQVFCLAIAAPSRLACSKAAKASASIGSKLMKSPISMKQGG